MYENFYLDKLYPLQDKVLKIIEPLNTEFYLTGGTALSRCYLMHRYSDDLDFFVNDSNKFDLEATKIQKAISENYILNIQRVSERFRRYFVIENDVTLKIELINDVPFHLGDLKSFEIFNRVDGILNILSNKITAITDRDEEKDFADLFSIVRNLKEVDWQNLFISASSKSAGIFVPIVAERISKFNYERLERLKWISTFNWQELKQVQIEIVNKFIYLT